MKFSTKKVRQFFTKFHLCRQSQPTTSPFMSRWQSCSMPRYCSCVSCGSCLTTWSQVHFERSMLTPTGNFKTFKSFIYCFSMAIATTRTGPITEDMTTLQRYTAVFDSIVRPEMRDSWNKKWKDWFCTLNTVEENLTPGKLKCK